MQPQLAVFFQETKIRKSTRVAQQHPRRDLRRSRILRQLRILRIFRKRFRQVLIDRLIEVQFPLIHQFHHRVSEGNLGKRGSGHHRFRRERQFLFAVAEPVCFQISDPSVVEDGNRRSRHFRGFHQRCNFGVNSVRLNPSSIKPANFGRKAGDARQEQPQQQNGREMSPHTSSPTPKAEEA